KQYPLQYIILYHHAQRAVIFVGDEVNLSGFQAVIDEDLVNIAAMWLQLFGQSDRLEYVPACAVDGRNAPVMLCIFQNFRISAINDRNPQSVGSKGQCLSQPDQPCTQYNHI